MDVLMSKRVQRWAEQAGLEGKLGEQFEQYAANIYLNTELRDIRVLGEIASGGGDDGGVDSAAVIINGQVVSETDDIDDLLTKGNANRIELFFMQAKTSQSFDMKLIAKFLHGIESICRDAIKGHGNYEFTCPSRWRWICDLIMASIERVERFAEPKFGFRAIYVTTADNNCADNVKSDDQVQSAIRRIEELSLFATPLNFVTHGQAELHRASQELTGPQNVKFNLPKRVSMPTAEQVTEAVLGIIDGGNLKTLLMENGNKRRHIFDANVRLYQGRDNEVNKRIQATLRSPDKIQEFPFLNNGLTVVANTMRITGDQVNLSGYHIVNGGQTSIEIINWIKDLDNGELEKLLVPIKIIASENEQLRRSITIATNLQTAITDTDIQSSTDIAQRVEEYFDGSGSDGLRYQRQSSSKNMDFVQLRVFDTDTINRSMESCIFGNSSRTSRSPKELRDVANPIWSNSLPLPAYYFSAWITYRVDSYFNRNKTQYTFKIRAARYHIAMMTSVLTIPKLREVFQISEEVINGKQGMPFDRIFSTLKGISEFRKGFDDWDAISERIEINIQTAVDIALDFFGETLRDKSNLIKDDVRNNSVQVELFSRIKPLLDTMGN